MSVDRYSEAELNVLRDIAKSTQMHMVNEVQRRTLSKELLPEDVFGNFDKILLMVVHTHHRSLAIQIKKPQMKLLSHFIDGLIQMAD